VDWKREFREMLAEDKFSTDSDIENFADKHNVPCGRVFHYLDELKTKGTRCEGCKHIGFRYSMYPCNICNRAPYIKDMYER